MLALSATVLSLAAAASATKSLKVSTAAPSELADVSDLSVTTKIENTGDETLKLLIDPRSALSSWATNTFTVTHADSGASVDFTGVKVRYTPEAAAQIADAITTLAPGESIDVAHEVGRYYNFTSAGEGAFHFEPTNLFTAVEADGSLTELRAEVAPAAVRLAGQLATSKALSPSSLGGAADARFAARGLHKRAQYTSSCTSSYRSQTDAAISAASRLASNSISHLEANPSGSTLQTTWYGTFASSRYRATLSAFETLVSAPASWTYDCSCTEAGTYAYVYPDSYGEVYLCSYFWQAPSTGSGSRADTIIHEGTHFPEVLGTDDVTYGESSCKALARSNPAQAVNNADNHAFFSDYA
ncbi:hypothetical protein HDZ31DRAFT_67522 [Schizophyllum fasciatum]